MQNQPEKPKKWAKLPRGKNKTKKKPKKTAAKARKASKAALKKAADTSAMLATVRRLAGQGMTQEQIGAKLGITGRQFRRRKDKDPDLMSAYEAGKAETIDEVTSILLTRIKDGSNPLLMFYLKCCAGWTEQKATQKLEVDQTTKADMSIEHSGKIAVDLSSYTPDQLEALIDKLPG